jgi:hypothetical protein
MRYFENKDNRHKDTLIPAVMLNYEIYKYTQQKAAAKSQQAVSEQPTNPVISSNKNCESDILLVKNPEISSNRSGVRTKSFEILENKDFQSGPRISSRPNEVIEIFDVDLETERGICENISIPYQEPSPSHSQRDQLSDPTIDSYKLTGTNRPTGTIEVQGRSEDSISVLEKETPYSEPVGGYDSEFGAPGEEEIKI